MSQERLKDLNLTPPEESFELYRYRNAERMSTRGWSGLYWARKNEAGDYEIWAVRKEGKGTPIPGTCSRKKPSRVTTRRPTSFRARGSQRERRSRLLRALRPREATGPPIMTTALEGVVGAQGEGGALYVRNPDGYLIELKLYGPLSAQGED